MAGSFFDLIGGIRGSRGTFLVGAEQHSIFQVIDRHVWEVFQPYLNNYSTGVVVGPGTKPGTIQQSGYGECTEPQDHDIAVLTGYDTTASVDEYQLPLDGGPQRDDQTQNMDTGQSGSTVAVGKKGANTKPRSVSGIAKGPGIAVDAYGCYPFTDSTGATHQPLESGPSRLRSRPRIRVGVSHGITHTTTKSKSSKGSSCAQPGDDPDEFLTVNLATVGGVLAAGLVKDAGDDGEGLAANPGRGLEIKDNTLQVVDSLATAGGLLSYVAGAGICLGQLGGSSSDAGSGSGTDGSQRIAVTVELAMVSGQARAGLCTGGGDDGNGLMIDLATQQGTGGRLGAQLSFVPADMTERVLAGQLAQQQAAALAENPHPPGTLDRGWWTYGYLAAEQGTPLLTAAGPSPSPSGSGTSGTCGVVACGGAVRGSGLQLDAGGGGQLAVYLATYAGAGSDGGGASAACPPPGAGLGFGGDDGEGLAVLADPGGGLCVGALGMSIRLATAKTALAIVNDVLAVQPDMKTIDYTADNTIQALAVKSPNGSTDPVGTSNNPWGCGPNAWTPSGTTGEGPVATTTSSSTAGGLPTSPTTPPASGSYPTSTSTSPPGPGYNCAGNAPATTKYTGLTFDQADVAKYSAKSGSGFTFRCQTSDPASGSLLIPTGPGGHGGSGYWLQYEVTILNNHVDPHTGWTGIATQGVTYPFHAVEGEFAWVPLDQSWHVVTGFIPGGDLITSVQPGLTAHVAFYGDCQGGNHLLLGSDASHFTEFFLGQNFHPPGDVSFEFGSSGCYSSDFPRTSTSPIQPQFQISNIYCSDGVPPGTVIANFGGSYRNTGYTFDGTPGTMDINGQPILPLMGMPVAPVEALSPILTGAFPAGETFGVTIDSTTDPSYDPGTVSDLQAQASAACGGCSATGAPFYTCSGIVSGGPLYAPNLTGDHIHALKDFLDDGDMLVKGKAEIDGTVLLKSDVELQGKLFDADGNQLLPLTGAGQVVTSLTAGATGTKMTGDITFEEGAGVSIVEDAATNAIRIGVGTTGIVTGIKDNQGHKAQGDVTLQTDGATNMSITVDPTARTATLKMTSPSAGATSSNTGVGAGTGGTAGTFCSVTYAAGVLAQCGSPPIPLDQYGVATTFHAATCSFTDSHGAAYDPLHPPATVNGSVPPGFVPIPQCPSVTPFYDQGSGTTAYQYQLDTSGTSGGAGSTTDTAAAAVVSSLNGLSGDLAVVAKDGLTLQLLGVDLVLGNSRPGYTGGPFATWDDATLGPGTIDSSAEVTVHGAGVTLAPAGVPVEPLVGNPAAGTALVPATYHGYCTVVVAGVESPHSQPVAVVVPPGSQTIDWTVPPQASSVTAVNIYRTPANSTTGYGLVGSLAGHAGGTLADTTPDASLGAGPGTPASVRYTGGLLTGVGTDAVPTKQLAVRVGAQDGWVPWFPGGFASSTPFTLIGALAQPAVPATWFSFVGPDGGLYVFPAYLLSPGPPGDMIPGQSQPGV